MLSDREEQLKPLGLGKRNKTFSAVVDGVEWYLSPPNNCVAGLLGSYSNVVENLPGLTI
jgi:hypothetical protein